MDKITFDIPSKTDGKWGSYISKYPADSAVVPPNAFTSGSRNGITSASGQAEKRQGGAIWNPASLLSGAALDQYEAVFSSGLRLFLANDAGTLKASTGNGLFTSVTAGFTNPANFEFATYQSRVYGCNGVDAPICLDIVTSYGGVSYSFTTAKTKTMGAQAPGSAATATRNTDSTASQVPAGSHTYKITFVYYSGVEESNGSAASSVCINDSTHTSNALTAIPVGGYGVTARRIYRDNNDGNWLLLDVLNNNTATTYTDILPIGSTPTAIPTTSAVPGVFKYIALYLDRLFTIDVTGKIISWSSVGQPDVFNPANTINGPQDDVMTAVYIFNGIPYVFGQHTLGSIQGTTDGSFYYSPISTSVGCVDNRSIQTRSIVSVPTMLWLAATPNKGIYYTNGSIVQYLSDFIEDLTFNLAQISYLARQNTQASQTAFQGGTASPAIDLTSNPGTIQTIDPVASYSHAADWATGTLSNLTVMGDSLGVPTLFAPTLASGALGGSAQISGGTLNFPTAVKGEDHTTAGTESASHTAPFAQPIDPALGGSRTLATVTLKASQNAAIPITNQFTISVYSDLANKPGTALYTSGTQTSTAVYPALDTITVSPNLAITQGNRYWIVVTPTVSSAAFAASPSVLFRGLGAEDCLIFFGGAWVTPSEGTLSMALAYTVSAISAAGSWTSPVYDSQSTTLTSGMKLALTATYPASTSASVLVQGSANQSAWTTTDTLSNPTGTTSLTGGVYRYWRTIINLATTDNSATPTVGVPTLTFNTTGVWTSPAILCTADITVLNALTNNTLLPAGTTVLVQIRTSADAISWSAYSTLGTATPNKYAQIKVTLTADTSDATAPTLLQIELDWTVSANLISSAIDTGATPAGWGVFQFNQVGMTGTVAFYFRSAASSGALTGASWTAVSNGTFPTSSPLEFCQWKAVMGATAGSIPQVNSVTVNWLLSSGRNVRAASLFFNKSYYLAVATEGSTSNNLLIEYDYQGNWRIHSGVNIGAMATYFNDAFYCDANNGNVYNGFKLPTDNGTNITFDLRSKCFVYGDDDHLAIVRSCRVKGVNTGTTIHVYYSLDRGTTWVEMLNSSSALGYTTTNDGSEFIEYFIPNFDGSVKLSARSVIYRVVSSDQYPCAILKIQPTAYLRKGKAITEAMA